MHFSSALLLATAALAVAAPSQKQKRVKNFKWFGINESGAEFGGTKIPGTLGTDYTWPVTSTIDTLTKDGFNIFRIPFLMERLAPGSMTASLNSAYLSGLTTIVNYITNTKGAYAIVDPHNFGRYSGSVFTNTADFKTFWTNVAKQFASNSKVIFDCNNEFHDEPSTTLVAQLNQACIDGVRAAGATSQYVFVEGTFYSGAWSWTSSGNGDAMKSLSDPQNKIIYEMHQYLDSDGSGGTDSCVSSTIGSQRLKDATSWLKSNGKKGIIGEFAGGVNSNCESAVKDMLSYMVSNKDVWTGALWWGGGPWWGNYIFAFEPPSSTAFGTYLSILQTYM